MEIRLNRTSGDLLHKLDIADVEFSESLYQDLTNPFRFYTTEREALESSLSGLRSKLDRYGRECHGKVNTKELIAQFEVALSKCQ